VQIRSALIALALAAAPAVVPAAAAQSGNFGRSGAVLGGDLFVGQPANFYGPGVVYLYRADARGAWREAARLVAPDSARGDDFGWSIAGDGAALLIGSPNKHDSRGAVYLFARQGGAGAWRATASLQGPARAGTGGFGAALAMANGVAFVGAPAGDSAGMVFELVARDGRLSERSVLAPALGRGAQFGSAVSLEGELLLVGAPRADSGAGAAVVFRRQADGSWRQDGVLSVTSGRRPTPRAGMAVLLKGGRAFVGAPVAGGTGAVLIFSRGEGGWRQTGELRAADGKRGDGFGAVLSAAGSEIWVGAPNVGDGDGAVYRFAARAGGEWAAAERIQADSAETAAWRFAFGSSIAAGDAAAVIGMPQRDFGEGRAMLLARQGGAWRPSGTVTGQIFTVGAGMTAGRVDCAGGKIAGFDCSNVELVSFLPVDQLGGGRGVWVNDVWGWTDPATGRDYALVSRRDGAAFVDVTEPERPRLVGSLPRTAGSRPSVWRDIKVYNNHAYVVSDGAGAHGMQVFDLTRLRAVTGAPVTFTEDGHYDGIFSAHNVVADTTSGFLYVVGANGGGETCGGGLHMVDARNPKQPVFAGCYTDKTGANARGYTHDAQCVVYRGPDTRYRGREICVAANEVEINIADVTDKANPKPIGRSSYPNVAYAHQGWFDESQRYFYMGDEGDELTGKIAGTRTLVWDLTQLDDPIVAKEYIGPVMATDHNLFVKGDRVYMANYGSGLRVLDISDRANPKEVAFFDSAPVGNNEAGMSATASGAWSNYPFFESGLVVFTSVREGLFIVKVKPAQLVP